MADIEALPFPPKTVNIKPSRLGPLSSLGAAYDYCEREGIGAYGGGQSELSVGRDHIQYLAPVVPPRHAQRHGAEGVQPPTCRTASRRARSTSRSRRTGFHFQEEGK